MHLFLLSLRCEAQDHYTLGAISTQYCTVHMSTPPLASYGHAVPCDIDHKRAVENGAQSTDKLTCDVQCYYCVANSNIWTPKKDSTREVQVPSADMRTGRCTEVHGDLLHDTKYANL